MLPVAEKKILTIYSPPLAELVVACNQKSINLYAEAFCKTIGRKNYGKGDWPNGIKATLAFARNRHIPLDSIRLNDGSGLSPDNRINTAMIAEMLRQNVKASWYPVFYKSLPLINDIHMKSGYIGGTRAYAGYITIPDGKKTCFSFILHHYSCTPAEAKLRMFQLLNLLKGQ